MSDKQPLVDMTPEQWEIVRDILKTHVPRYEVWAFGSRAKWTAKSYSDLDLAIIGTERLPTSVLATLDDAFSESDLPWKVDVVDWAATEPYFQEIIQRDKVVMQREESPLCFLRDEWHEVMLGEVVEIFDGPHATPKKTPSGPIFLGISNLSCGRIDLTNSEHISEEDFKKWTRRVTPASGDVVFSYETRLGEAALIPAGLPCCLGRRMGLLRAKKGRIDSRFLLYAYLGPDFQETIRQRTIHGSTVDRIPLIEMANFPIRVPGIETQRAIAHILGTLDDKIELNRKMNETLEAMARAIFKSWFIDFEFNNGEMPIDWSIHGLDSVATFLNGLALQKYPPTDSSYLPVIKIAQLRKGNARDADRASCEIPSAYKIQNGDVLFSWSGSLLVKIWCGGEGALNQHLFKVESDRFPKWFYYLWLQHHLPDFQAIAASKATTMGHIQRHHLTSAQVMVPSIENLTRLDVILGPLIDRFINNELESTTLTELRDVLLPKLLSGEISTKGAEKQLEAAL